MNLEPIPVRFSAGLSVLCILLAACAGQPVVQKGPAAPVLSSETAAPTDNRPNPSPAAATAALAEAVTPAGIDPAPLLPEPNLTAVDKLAQPDLFINLWERIRAGFALEDIDDPRIEAQLNWYASRQDYLDRVVTRAQPYFYYIVEEVEKRGMPLEIALLPIVESAFDPFAYSHGRAAGLWQFIPDTGRRYSLRLDWWYDGRRDVAESTRAALDYLEALHKDFNGDWLHALAAYNSGEGKVHRAIRHNAARGKSTDFWNLGLPRETSAYVPKLLALKKLVAQPEKYGVTWTPIPNRPYLARVALPGQMDLALAAELADIPLTELYLLNPGFNRWATSPDGPHEIFIPVDRQDMFLQRLAQIPSNQLMRWQRHVVASGETLSSIASRYHITIEALKQANNLHGSMIRAGQPLLVPAASLDLAKYALSADARLARTQATPHGSSRLTYTVRAGDTLWQIARQYGASVAELAKWNGMAPGDPLQIGQELVVWEEEPVTTADAAGTGPVRPVGLQGLNTLRTVNYIVRRGDSLSRIAKLFGVTVNDLRRWNGFAKNALLRPGQRVKVLVDVTNQSTRS